MTKTRIVVVDNFDSFVYNIVQYLAQLDAEVDVVRNNEISLEQAAEYDGIMLSPGPGAPADAGMCIPIVEQLGGQVPIFGVCLGHQAIAEAFGCVVDRAPELLHGKTSQVLHDHEGVFRGLPSPFTATRYHSLAIDGSTLVDELEVTAKTDSGVIMGVKHRELQVEGVQFHPESVLTQHGHLLFANWLEDCGDSGAVERSVGLNPVVQR